MDIQGYSVADYHVHPDFSFDGEGSVEEYCQMALAQGLTEICFTTHFDTNPLISARGRSMRINGELVPHSIANFAEYYRAVKLAHEQFYLYGLSVKCGVEIGYYPGCEKETSELIKKYPMDHVIGSIHEIDEYSICNESDVEALSQKYSLKEFMEQIYSLTGKMIETELFDAVGHLDRYRTYGKKYFGDEILTGHRGHIEEIFELLKKHSVGYEINTLAVHFGEPEYYPCMDIVNKGRKLGVKPISIGSDAHSPEELSRDFEMAVAIAYELFPYRGE